MSNHFGSPCADNTPLETAVAAGQAAPDFTYRDAQGITHSCRDFRGAPLILAFLGQEWNPARAEYLARYRELLRDAGLHITHDGQAGRAIFSGEAESVPLLNFSDAGTPDIARLYGVENRHGVFVIDGEGTVVWRFVAPVGVYPHPDTVRDALPTGLLGENKATGVSRRGFLATALAAAFALALQPVGMVESRAAVPGQAASAVPNPAPTPTLTTPVTLLINGQSHTLNLEPRVALLDALIGFVGLTGTKKGCDHGQCGACTVHIDGRRINSCLTLAVMQQSRPITTIEGLASGETLHPVQAAFIAHDGFQCGYCTPGQIMSAAALLTEGHAHTRADVCEGMSGNLCRCGAYPNIVDAVESVRTASVSAGTESGENSHATV